MIRDSEFKKLLLACEWAKEQEKIILKNGIPLNDDQQIDAYLIGVKEPSKVRLLSIKEIPLPNLLELKSAVNEIGLIKKSTIGITFKHGIYIKSEYWNNRRLIVHELTHTMQYERLGGFEQFLSQYLDECIRIGYPFGPLEQEAIEMEKRICI